MNLREINVAAPPDAVWQVPTRAAATIFAVKAFLLRARRHLKNLRAGPPKLAKAAAEPFPYPIAISATPLRPEGPAEHAMQAGKIQNLRVAARALDGTLIPTGAVFSVWRQLGPPAARRGYVPGRMLREGCLVPSVGGGLCQLSNALYDAALQAGCQIIERHAHSRLVPGSAAALGRDATIAWNYIDLRFAPPEDLRLSVRLDADVLHVGLAARTTKPSAPAILPDALAAPPIARSCGTCAETACFRHAPAPAVRARHAFLLDENWPEFRAYLKSDAKPADAVLLPLDGARLRLARYAWPGVSPAGTAPIAALHRAAALRLAANPPARRRAEFTAAARLADSLARKLPTDVETLTVAQSYLPFLYRNGHLGGRTYSVLMTRLPIAALQARLDEAAAARPAQTSLTDFRAPAWLAALESEALEAAAEILTPHTEIARLFPGRAQLLPWTLPPAKQMPPPNARRILFPGPTIARKGAHELREAARALDLEITPLGANLETPDFWSGVRLAPEKPWHGALAMVQPAWVEDQPRRLLAALAAGLPVIATEACGLPPHPNLTLIPPGNTSALIETLSALL